MMKMLVAGAALAVLVAPPAFAQRQGIGDTAPQINTRVHPENVQPRARAESRRHAAPRGGRHAASAYRARAEVNPSGDHMDAARAAAMRECTENSRKYSQTTWGTMELHNQRACMAAKGLPE